MWSIALNFREEIQRGWKKLQKSSEVSHVVLQTRGLGVGLVTHQSFLTVSVNYKLALAIYPCKD